jgi:hypothetical protein
MCCASAASKGKPPPAITLLGDSLGVDHRSVHLRQLAPSRHIARRREGRKDTKENTMHHPLIATSSLRSSRLRASRFMS